MSDRKVYIVTSGEYSDYTIDSVHSTRKGAESRAGHLATTERYIGNVAVRAWDVLAVPDDVIPYEYRKVWERSAGWVQHSGWRDTDPYETKRWVQKGVTIHGETHRNSKGVPHGVQVWGFNKDQVNKVFYDRLAQAKHDRMQAAWDAGLT